MTPKFSDSSYLSSVFPSCASQHQLHSFCSPDWIEGPSGSRGTGGRARGGRSIRLEVHEEGPKLAAGRVCRHHAEAAGQQEAHSGAPGSHHITAFPLHVHRFSSLRHQEITRGLLGMCLRTQHSPNTVILLCSISVLGDKPAQRAHWPQHCILPHMHPSCTEILQ